MKLNTMNHGGHGEHGESKNQIVDLAFSMPSVFPVVNANLTI